MMRVSSSITDLAGALSAAQADFDAVPKEANNPFFKSKYADLAAVVRTAAPVLAKHGLAVLQTIGYSGDTDTLSTTLLHTSGQWVTDTMRLHLTKSDPQGQGSAVTYARRYSYMAVLGLVADDDDDGNAASTQQRKKGSRPLPAGPPPTTSRAHLEQTDLQVPAVQAKTRLKEAAGGDVAAAREVWGDRGSNSISEAELQRLFKTFGSFEVTNDAQ